MLRGRRQENDDGMGLFLDAICNAFGGIIFISILLALVAQVTVSEYDSTDTQAIQRSNDQFNELEQEVERLERIEAQLATISKNVVDQELKNLEKEHVERAKVVQDREESLRLSRQSRTTQMQRLSEAEAALKSLPGRISEARKQVRLASTNLDEERRKRSLEVNLPKTRRSSKKRLVFALSFDRLYTVFRDPVAEDELNADQLKLIGKDSFRADPKSGSSLDGKQWKRDLLGVLGKVAPDTHAVRLIVWADSFDSWKKVRRELVDCGFEYSLLLLDNKEVVSFGGGGQRLVQ